MGVDISLHFEWYDRANNKWTVLEIPQCLHPDDRSYVMFGLLAGIRSTITPLFADRGIPKDSSLKNLTDIGNHGFTYAYLDELQRIDWDALGVEEDWIPNCYWRAFVDYVLPRIASEYWPLRTATTPLDPVTRDIRILMGFA